MTIPIDTYLHTYIDADFIDVSEIPHNIRILEFVHTVNIDWSSLQIPDFIHTVEITNCDVIDFGVFQLPSTVSSLKIVNTTIYNLNSLNNDIKVLTLDINNIIDNDIIFPDSLEFLICESENNNHCGLINVQLPSSLISIDFNGYNSLNLYEVQLPNYLQLMRFTNIPELNLSHVSFPSSMLLIMLSGVFNLNPQSHIPSDINVSTQAYEVVVSSNN